MEYNVSQSGIVKNPGKFQGEPFYSVEAYDRVCVGDCLTYVSENEECYDYIEIDKKMIEAYPDLTGHKILIIMEDENGFVWTKPYRSLKELSEMVD